MSSAIVVGGGSAGAVVARRLHDAGVVTTLLEAGGEDLNPAIHDPSRAGELWHGPEDWARHTVPQEHAAGRRLHLPRGKVLGGSHALNAMIWVRCAPSDYDGWEAAGCTGWGWDTVRPVYEAIENDLLPVTDDYRSRPSRRASSPPTARRACRGTPITTRAPWTAPRRSRSPRGTAAGSTPGWRTSSRCATPSTSAQEPTSTRSSSRTGVRWA